jgi:hypothetical protein
MGINGQSVWARETDIQDDKAQVRFDRNDIRKLAIHRVALAWPKLLVRGC